MLPVLDHQNMQVQAYLAWLADDAVVGDNLRLVLFTRGQSVNDWDVKAWQPDVTLNDAVAYLRDQYRADLFTGDEQPVGLEIESGQIVVPTPLTDGLLADDPLQPAIDGIDEPELLLNPLLDSGWKGAPLLSQILASGSFSGSSISPGIGIDPQPIDDDCIQVQADPMPDDLLLELITARIETLIFGFTTSTESGNDCFCWGCTLTYGPWTCVNTGSSPNPGTPQFIFCDYLCTRTVSDSGSGRHILLACARCTGGLYNETKRCTLQRHATVGCTSITSCP